MNNQYCCTVPKIYYVDENLHISKEEYTEFYRTIKENFSKDKEELRKNNIKYFDESELEIENLIKQNSEKAKKDVNTYIRLTFIDSKNKDEFKWLLDDLLEEYNYLENLENDEPDYDYFKRLASWYIMSMECIDSALKNLSKNNINIKEFKPLIEENVKYNFIEM